MKSVFCLKPKLILKVTNDKNSALVPMMARHRKGDKPLYEPVMASFADSPMRHLTTAVS